MDTKETNPENPKNPPIDPDPDKSGRGPPVNSNSGEAKPGTATSFDGSVPAAPQTSNPTASMSAPAGGDATKAGSTGKMAGGSGEEGGLARLMGLGWGEGWKMMTSFNRSTKCFHW